MVEDDIEQTKVALRDKAHDARAALSPDERKAASQAACEHFFKAFNFADGQVVAAYWPIRDEMDCQAILIKLMDARQPVCLPVVLGEGEPLELRLWQDGAPLYPSGFGTLAPEELAPKAVPDIVLMPLLGFDKQGTRLGYGGGYYDRTLAGLEKKPRLIGLAFAVQEVDFIPRGDHDIPLDSAVTENGVTHFGTAQ